MRRLCVIASSLHIDCVLNVMTHAQKPDFVFRRNGRVHLNRQAASVQSTTGSRGVRISGSNAGYTMFWGSVKCTGYPLYSLVFPSLPLPWVTVCHHISTGLHRTDIWWECCVVQKEAGRYVFKDFPICTFQHVLFVNITECRNMKCHKLVHHFALTLILLMWRL
jgi:hypothetical protein